MTYNSSYIHNKPTHQSQTYLTFTLAPIQSNLLGLIDFESCIDSRYTIQHFCQNSLSLSLLLLLLLLQYLFEHLSIDRRVLFVISFFAINEFTECSKQRWEMKLYMKIVALYRWTCFASARMWSIKTVFLSILPVRRINHVLSDALHSTPFCTSVQNIWSLLSRNASWAILKN